MRRKILDVPLHGEINKLSNIMMSEKNLGDNTNDVLSMGDEKIKEQLEAIDKLSEQEIKFLAKLLQAEFTRSSERFLKQKNDHEKEIEEFRKQIYELQKEIETNKNKLRDLFNL
jgi:histidinol dehydrogenase